jgi:hypothetical protein
MVRGPRGKSRQCMTVTDRKAILPTILGVCSNWINFCLIEEYTCFVFQIVTFFPTEKQNVIIIKALTDKKEGKEALIGQKSTIN